MKVICAWCENEGKETLIGDLSLYDMEVTSHGICIDHQQGLLRQIEEVKLKQNPRLSRRRRQLAQPRSTGAPAVLNCSAPWRRRRKSRMVPAQLSLPFVDGHEHLPEAASGIIAATQVSEYTEVS